MKKQRVLFADRLAREGERRVERDEAGGPDDRAEHDHVDARLAVHGDLLRVDAGELAGVQLEPLAHFVGGGAGIDDHARLLGDGGRHRQLARHRLVEEPEDVGGFDGAVDAQVHVLLAPADEGLDGGTAFFRAVARKGRGVEPQVDRAELAEHLSAEVGAQPADAFQPDLVIAVVVFDRKNRLFVHLLTPFVCRDGYIICLFPESMYRWGRNPRRGMKIQKNWRTFL